MEGKSESKRNEKTEAHRNGFESFQRTLGAETQKQESEENHSNKEVMNHEEKMEMERIARNVQYGKELQQQMASRQQQRQCKYQDSLIENKKLEEVNRKMVDDDQRELERKRSETQRQYDEMVTSEQARKTLKDKQKEMIVVQERQVEQHRQTSSDRTSFMELQRKQEDNQHQRDDMATSEQDRKTLKDKLKEMNIVEDRQIEEERQASSDRTSSIIAEREHKLQMKDDHNQKIGAKTFSDEEARLERDNNTELVQAQECLDREAQDDEEEREKSAKMKNDLKEALIDQIDNKRRDLLKRKEEDAEFTKQNEALMAAGDEEEHEKKMREKEKARQYSQDLRQQIEDNARRARQHKREEASEQYGWEWDRDMSSKGSEKPPQVPGSPQAGTRETSDLPTLKNGNGETPKQK